MHKFSRAAACFLVMTSTFSIAQETVAPPSGPPGAEKTPKTRALEAGAKLLQHNRPMAGFDIYLVGFHPMKEHPEHQMEAHHYCHQRNEDFAQCVLFDSNTSAANMHGLEYIISEKLFESLPAAEKNSGTHIMAKF